MSCGGSSFFYIEGGEEGDFYSIREIIMEKNTIYQRFFMSNQIYVNWGGNKVCLKWVPYKEINKRELITSVHSYCFAEGKVLLVQVKERCFNIPGGHIELGENPEEALLREVYEEGYVTGDVKYIGAIEVNHRENENFLQNGPYPMIGYQLFYRMDIKKVFPFN